MEKEKNLIESLKQGGSLHEVWTTSTGLTMIPNPSIENIRWSIVQKGSGGTDAVDFYMNLKNAVLMFREIWENDGAAAKKKFEKDKSSDFPQAYTFVSGKDGSRKFGLGTGKNGLAVQIQNKETSGWKRKFIPVSWDDVRYFAFMGLLVLGLVPVSDGYYKDVKDAFYEGCKYRDSMHGKKPAQNSNPWA